MHGCCFYVCVPCRAFKLELHGTDTDNRDAPIMQFCKRVNYSLSCTVHVYMCASLTDILARKIAPHAGLVGEDPRVCPARTNGQQCYHSRLPVVASWTDDTQRRSSRRCRCPCRSRGIPALPCSFVRYLINDTTWKQRWLAVCQLFVTIVTIFSHVMIDCPHVASCSSSHLAIEYSKFNNTINRTGK